MAEGNVVTRALKRIVAGYRSLPGIVVRAIVSTLLGTGDLVSDVYTTVTLFSLSHLGPAYAMVAMMCFSMAAQVRATRARRLSLSLVSRRLWPHFWLRRRYWPSS
jgi:ABC-type dipeptide/oligopeptide/nickel transport system permease subunit